MGEGTAIRPGEASRPLTFLTPRGQLADARSARAVAEEGERALRADLDQIRLRASEEGERRRGASREVEEVRKALAEQRAEVAEAQRAGGVAREKLRGLEGELV
ncbi:hypothetical protein chiPu_0032391, partial [Chiloscyllium punctatum]|nr:hypothetical protein [Chiloscyllium punctatum]